MKRLVLGLVLGMLAAWNQSGVAQVETHQSSLTISGQADRIPDKAYRVTGQVLDDVTGRPLSGAEVSLVTVQIISNCVNCGVQPARPKPALPRITVTGTDGEFAFDGVPQGMINLKAMKAGYLDVVRPRIGTEPGVLSLTSDRKLVLRLAPAASISGVVRDHTDALIGKSGDIALYIVTYWQGWPHRQYFGWPKLEADGTYRFDGLEPGRYSMVVSPPWNRHEPERTVGNQAMGEVPVRYPAPTPWNPAPFFPLHEGEQKNIDFQIPEESLHHVILTAGPAPVSQVVSASGGVFMLHQAARDEDRFDVWLPDGTYWPTNDRPGEIDGPLPFKVAGADVSGLKFESAATGTTRLPTTVQITIDGAPDLRCGPFDAQSCYVATLYLLYLNPGPSVDVADAIQLTASPKSIGTTLLPGRYAAVVAAQRNLYVKSIRSGAFDLSHGPLVIRQGRSPAPIRVELAPAAKVGGVVRRNGKPVAADVYALAEHDTKGAEFRLFAHVESKDDGTFEMEGLGPGSWNLFASDAELNLDVHDPADTAYWRNHGTRVHLGTSRTANVVVNEAPEPER